MPSRTSARDRVAGYALCAACTAIACGREAPPPAVGVAPVTRPTPPEECEAIVEEPPAPPRGAKPPLPAVPDIPDAPARDGDVFGVAAATHAFRSDVERTELLRDAITVEGFIVDTNLGRAPRCAIHRAGAPDPASCSAEVPTFTLGETRSADAGVSIKVMGWASSFAQVLEAQRAATQGGGPHSDAVWAVDVPWPLPAVGAKVRVKGRYGAIFTKSSRGVATEPSYGVITYESMTVLEAAPEAAKLGS